MFDTFDLKGLASRSEHQLVLASVSAALGRFETEYTRTILDQDLDWDYCFRFARRHAVLPLLYIHLAHTAVDRVPARHLTQLKNYYHENTARNILLAEELTRVLNSLGSRGIDAISYKGPSLAVFAYGNLAHRSFIDLDIMVSKRDVMAAKEALNSIGYQYTNRWTTAQESLLLRTQHNLPFRDKSGRFVVELHWEVASELFASSLQAEQLWRRLQPVNLNGVEVKTLGCEDLLLSLCVHGSRHLWERLGWICDVAALLRKDVDWAGLLQRAETTENLRMLRLGGLLAKKLLGAPLPSDLEHKLRHERDLQRLARTVTQRLFDGAEFRSSSFSTTLSYNVRLRRDWRSRLRYLRLALMPTDADVSKIKLPRAVSFGYYLMRPFRLLSSGRGT
ncbi:MAG TPA: nucleotidyltransferase family protein [Pyrinomonadaceae bacterium]|nr:nucleotidyltransferase family protein [Pyrinomonadaceae bacterium]